MLLDENLEDKWDQLNARAKVRFRCKCFNRTFVRSHFLYAVVIDNDRACCSRHGGILAGGHFSGLEVAHVSLLSFQVFAVVDYFSFNLCNFY